MDGPDMAVEALDHRTYEKFRAWLKERVTALRDMHTLKQAGRGPLARLLFEIDGYDVAGPRPVVAALNMAAVEAGELDPGKEMRRHDKAMADAREWDDKVMDAGIDPENYA